MTKYERILKVLESTGPSKSGYTVAQIAGLVQTTPAGVRARVAEMRADGYAIYANTRSRDGKTFYRLGNPSRAMVAQAYAMFGSQAFGK